MTDLTCGTMYYGYDGDFDGEECPSEPVSVAVMGCVHEHVRRRPICADCLRLVDMVECLPCGVDPAVPHRCDLRLISTEPLDPGETSS